MYTNIDTNHALQMLKQLFKTFPYGSIHPGLLRGIEIIMKECIFQFGATHWLQLSGTAMGTPPAPMYATLYFAIHEAIVLPQFPQLLFYKRYIDDALGIWIPKFDLIEDAADFTQLQMMFDTYGKLCWEFEALSTSTHFLDINIHITGTQI